MARIGAFDRLLEPLAWWEAELLPAGWYVDELIASQQGPPPAPSTKLWLRVGGVWKETTVYIRISGVWKQADPFIKISGVWK
jgi:hypothetical protein